MQANCQHRADAYILVLTLSTLIKWRGPIDGWAGCALWRLLAKLVRGAPVPRILVPHDQEHQPR